MSKCDKCGGACCRYVRIKVGAMMPDQERWANMRGTVDGDMWVIRAKCEHLTPAGKCGIYEWRPCVCREFDVGGAHCEDARKRWKTAKGADNGDK